MSSRTTCNCRRTAEFKFQRQVCQDGCFSQAYQLHLHKGHLNVYVARRVPYQLQKTVRGGAVVGLLRIEQDGAYAALLSHSGESEPPEDSPGNDPDQGVSAGNGDATGAKSGAQTGGTKPQHSGQAARETTWLVSGVTRWRRQLDAIISNLLTGDRSVDDLDPAVRQVWHASA